MYIIALYLPFALDASVDDPLLCSEMYTFRYEFPVWPSAIYRNFINLSLWKYGIVLWWWCDIVHPMRCPLPIHSISISSAVSICNMKWGNSMVVGVFSIFSIVFIQPYSQRFAVVIGFSFAFGNHLPEMKLKVQSMMLIAHYSCYGNTYIYIYS